MSSKSNFFAMPLKRIELFSVSAPNFNSQDDGSGAVLDDQYITSESNVIIEPITQRNDLGGETTAGYRSVITIYSIIHEEENIRFNQFKKMAKWKSASAYVYFGGENCGYKQPSTKSTQITYNESLAVSFQAETVPGFIRYVIKLTGITKEFPKFTFTH